MNATAKPGPREALVHAVRALSARGLTPATSGNFSVRADAGAAWLTASGVDKATLDVDDLLLVALDGGVLGAAPGRRPSAESALHTALYRRFPDVGAVLHVHARTAVLLSVVARRNDAVCLTGWELQKALRGVTTHEALVTIPVLDNDQDIDRLAATVDDRLTDDGPPAYLLRGHGLYVWGTTLDEALRHLDALDVLLGYELALRGVPA